MFESKKQKIMTYIVGGVYLVLLTWLVLFKFSTNFTELPQIRNINLIPFHYDTEVSALFHVKEVGYNVLIFVPLGVYVSILKYNWNFFQKILPGLVLSLLFEIIQYLFAIGASDITDLLGNTLGGMLGIVICHVFHRVFKNKYITVINDFGLVGEILAIIVLTILIIANH